MQRKDLPANVVIGVSLPFQNGKLRYFDIFRERIDGFVSQTLSVPWLAEYIKTHPQNKFEIRFVNDRSFSDKGEDNFSDIMKKGGKQAQANEIAGLLAQSTFLQVEEKERWSRWLVLPDKRMVLWDFRGESVLKWKASEFETWTPHGTRDWYGAFAIISTNGEIQVR